MEKYICIHGHFYQPPRENPWTGQIETQVTAAPFHDWNERIDSQCYTPNTSSKILDESNQLVKMVNNYEWISFNFGPTLLSWMAEHSPDTYSKIIKADKDSMRSFSGHGSAIAQAFHHIIMPLANSRDKRTQIFWGIEDFEFRFNRAPEGMWLPETAVDLETLDMLAEYGIKYTILAPNQAEKIRAFDTDEWVDVDADSLDTTKPYLCRLPSKRLITLFFYQGQIAQEVAFGKLLKNGIRFSDRLIKEFEMKGLEGGLVHFATDGETYGHHHKFGEMALSFMLEFVREYRLAKLTNYGEFLENYPPQSEVRISENTSWSCSHGVERWQADCGCKLKIEVESSQEWRVHLREALDWLRDEITPAYEKKMNKHFKDPWAVRDQYIHYLLDPESGKFQKEILKGSKNLSEEELNVQIFPLLEMQRMLMMMYTSCGWFFDDISGIETVQILLYAARAMRIFEQHFNRSYEEEFVSRLKEAQSNHPHYEDGQHVYEALVKNKIQE